MRLICIKCGKTFRAMSGAENRCPECCHVAKIERHQQLAADGHTFVPLHDSSFYLEKAETQAYIIQSRGEDCAIRREIKHELTVALRAVEKAQRVADHQARHEAALERRRNRYKTHRQYFRDYWHSPRGKQISREHNAVYMCNRRAGGALDLPAFYAKCEMLNWHCQICGKVLTKETVTIDHIIPVSKGGTNDIENLQPMCRSCNSRKGNRPMSNYIVNVSFTITPTIYP